jgi:hypothetical protein
MKPRNPRYSPSENPPNLGGFRVTPEEADLLERVVAFANMRRLRSTREVENLFMQSARAARPFKVIPASRLQDYRKDQWQVQQWLKAIATLGEAARPRIGPDVGEMLGTVHVRMRFDAERGQLSFVGALNGVQAMYSYAVALLLDRTRNLTGRLGRCGWCGKFRLNLRAGPGRPPTHCNEDHRRRADAKRRREARKKRKEEERP